MLITLEKELSTEEYIEFLRAITPKFKVYFTELLREFTRDLPMDEVFGKSSEKKRERVRSRA